MTQIEIEQKGTPGWDKISGFRASLDLDYLRKWGPGGQAYIPGKGKFGRGVKCRVGELAMGSNLL